MHRQNPYDPRGHVYDLLPYSDVAPKASAPGAPKVAVATGASPAQIAVELLQRIHKALEELTALQQKALTALEGQTKVYGEPIVGRYPQRSLARENVVRASPRPLTIMLTADSAQCMMAFTQGALMGLQTFVIPTNTTITFELPPGSELWVTSATVRAANVAILPHVPG